MTVEPPGQPLYLIGDCHVDGLHGARVLNAHNESVAFGTKFHIAGMSASEFLDSSGAIDAKIVAALVGFQALRFDHGQDEPLIDSSVVGSNLFGKSFRTNKHVLRDPVLFSVGDFDARRLVSAVPIDADIAIAFEPRLLANVPKFEATGVIAGRPFQEAVLQMLRPLFVGLRHLQGMGFCNIALQSIIPPTIDDTILDVTVGTYSRALTRYKVRLLINQCYKAFCESSNIHFIDRWDDLTDDGGRIRPDRLMPDGFHVHYEYMRPSLAKLYELTRLPAPV